MESKTQRINGIKEFKEFKGLKKLKGINFFKKIFNSILFYS